MAEETRVASLFAGAPALATAVCMQDSVFVPPPTSPEDWCAAAPTSTVPPTVFQPHPAIISHLMSSSHNNTLKMTHVPPPARLQPTNSTQHFKKIPSTKVQYPPPPPVS